MDENGVPRFQALQHRSRTRPERIVYYAFDALQLAGVDLMAKPLGDGRASRRSGVEDGETAECRADLLREVRVDLRRSRAAMAEDLLNDPQIYAGFKQVRRE